MQLTLFDDVTEKEKGVEYVVRSIIRSDSTRSSIKNAMQNNDRSELIKLFQQSIKTYGFGNTEFMWGSSRLRDRLGDKVYEITARELSDTALKLSNAKG